MGNPLQSDGVIGYLTDEQQRKLKLFWQEFLQLVDKAPEEGSEKGDKTKRNDSEKEGVAVSEFCSKSLIAKQTRQGHRKSLPRFQTQHLTALQPKDDAAKDRLRAEIELKEAKLALELYGSKKFMAVFWRFISFDDPDALMLRFCRARKWETARGVSMLAACMKWRVESGVEEIVRKGEEGYKDRKGFLEQFSSGKTYTQGTDRAGRPVVYIHVSLHKVFGQPADVMTDYVFAQMEAVRCLLADRAEKISMVFDMTSFGLSNMDWRVILLIVKCLEAYYPESLNCMIIHRAPFIFSGIWKILGPMFDPVVRNKVAFTKTTDDLLDHISKEHLVKRLGGENDFEWTFNGPKDGENELMEDTETRDRLQGERDQMIADYLKVTRKWIESDDKVIDMQRKYLAACMRFQAFQLDRYLRGVTVYHRHGNICGNGLVHFSYPGTKNGDEWEVLGYTRSRETTEVKIDKLAAEIKAAGGKVPRAVFDGSKYSEGNDAEAGEEKKPRRKSTSSRR